MAARQNGGLGSRSVLQAANVFNLGQTATPALLGLDSLLPPNTIWLYYLMPVDLASVRWGLPGAAESCSAIREPLLEISEWKTSLSAAAGGRATLIDGQPVDTVLVPEEPQRAAIMCGTKADGAAAASVFICPSTRFKVQHCLDDDEDVPDTEYEVVTCQACAKLHAINRKTGKLLGQQELTSEETADDATAV